MVRDWSIPYLEAHELVGDALREGAYRRVLDVPEQVLDAHLKAHSITLCLHSINRLNM